MVDENLLDLGAESDLAAVRDEQFAQVFGERADAAFELGHHRGAVVGYCQRERQTGGAARVCRARGRSS